MGTVCSKTPKTVNETGEKGAPKAEQPKSPAKDEQPKSPAKQETLNITWPSKNPPSDDDLRALIVHPTP